MVFMFGKKLFLALFIFILLALPVLADSSMQMQVGNTDYYVNSGDSLPLPIDVINVVDDDSGIDLVRFYLLGLSELPLSYSSHTGNFSYSESYFGDDLFEGIDITNSDALEITLNVSGSASEGTKSLRGYFSFNDDSGAQTGFGDNVALLPLQDSERIFTRIHVDNSPPEVSSSIESPMWLSDGITLNISITDASPVTAKSLSYSGNAGNGTLQITGNTVTIPATRIIEETDITYTITATDAAGNTTLTAPVTITPRDIPRINTHGPSSRAPNTELFINSNITDFSEITATLEYSVNGSPMPAKEMSSIGNDNFQASIGEFLGGENIQYTITGTDPFGREASVSGSFTVLNEYDITFTVKDEVTQENLSGVTITVQTGDSLTFDESTTLTLLEGTYDFVFSKEGYGNKPFNIVLDSDAIQTIFMGSATALTYGPITLEGRVPDNIDTYYVDILGCVFDVYEAENFTFEYSFSKGQYDQTLQLNKTTFNCFEGSIGPFNDPHMVYSRLRVVDGRGGVNLHNIDPHWFALKDKELADLYFESVGVNLDSSSGSTFITFSPKVAVNTGSVETPFGVEFYKSGVSAENLLDSRQLQEISAGNPFEFQTFYSSVSDPGNESQGLITADFSGKDEIKIPVASFQETGSISFYFVVDPDNAIQEYDEENNIELVTVNLDTGEVEEITYDEICFNYSDDDGDGLIDEGCFLGEKCGDGLDNDGDEEIDEGCFESLIVKKFDVVLGGNNQIISVSNENEKPVENAEVEVKLLSQGLYKLAEISNFLALTQPIGKVENYFTDNQGDAIYPVKRLGYYGFEVTASGYLPVESDYIGAGAIIELSPVVDVDSQQEITVINATTSEPAIDLPVKVQTPNGRILDFMTDGSGQFTIKANELGLYSVIAENNEIVLGQASFVSSVDFVEVLYTDAGPVSNVLNTFETAGNLLIAVLLLLSVLAAGITYRFSRILFEEAAESTRQEILQRNIKIVLAGISFIVPLLSGLLTKYSLGVLIGIIELALIFGVHFGIKQYLKYKKYKPVKVV